MDSIDITELAEKTDGYSGADIEGVVKEGIENAFIKNCRTVRTEDIMNAINNTHSLKEIMGDSIEKLEREYEERKFKSAS